jgi:D-xylose 1-dehydrogenase
MVAVQARRARYPSLADKRVLITGGGSGIGAGLVEAFVAQGARVLFCDIADAAAATVALRLTPGAVHAPLYRRCDLTDVAAVQALVAEAEAALGGLDVLVNNAGNDERHALEAVTPAYWDDRIAVNLRHLFFAAQAAVPAMRRAGGGAILNFGSLSWHLGMRDLSVYQTAKAAIEGMSRGMARELGRDRIRVATIVPGNVQTPRQDAHLTPEDTAAILARQCLDTRIQPADVAALVLFLASDDARMCTGHGYFVDAGWR